MLVWSAAGPAAVSAADQITIAGSTTVKPIVETGVQQFNKNNPALSSSSVEVVPDKAFNWYPKAP
jgi:ABC-type phosphate transport system substrate-binding protein